jgi:hypothetical protein
MLARLEMSTDCALGFFLVVVSRCRTCQAKRSVNFFPGVNVNRGVNCQSPLTFSANLQIFFPAARFFLFRLYHTWPGGIVANVYV